MRKKVLIIGAAGRDFHNFNVFFRNNPLYQVVCFTATQIPGIEDKTYPPVLAGKNYPKGIPIYSEERLEELIKKFSIDIAVFSYSDISHEYLMHRASRVLSSGADFWLLGPTSTMFRAKVPVISVCAVRTGSGKSQTTRKVIKILRELGKKVVAVRHPMPYGDLAKMICQRFATYDDLKKYHCTIEEREEYEPILNLGAVVYAGVDYEVILKKAEKEADVIVWDGGNNDFPFYQSDLEIVVADPLRVGHETRYHPGETNLRRADVIVINKENTASPLAVKTLKQNIRSINKKAIIIDANSIILTPDKEKIKNQRVLVIEDGPTLTHGEMSYGAGFVAAKQWRAKKIVSPYPYAFGSIKETYEKYKQTRNVLPAMGYGEKQIKDLEKTINKMPIDLVIIATPIDLTKLLKIKTPSIRITYELEEISQPDLREIISKKLKQF